MSTRPLSLCLTLSLTVSALGCDRGDGFRQFQTESPFSGQPTNYAVTSADPPTLEFGFRCYPESKDDLGPDFSLVMLADSTLEKKLLDAGLRDNQDPLVTVKIGDNFAPNALDSDGWLWNFDGGRLMGVNSTFTETITESLIDADTAAIRLESRESLLVLGEWAIPLHGVREALASIGCPPPQGANDE